MGYLTTITIYNDALNDFKNDPRAFAIAIFEGIDEANDTCKSAHVLLRIEVVILLFIPRGMEATTLFMYSRVTV